MITISDSIYYAKFSEFEILLSRIFSHDWYRKIEAKKQRIEEKLTKKGYKIHKNHL